MRKLDMDRIHARRLLATSERHLSGILSDRLADEEGLGRIRSKGDEALFGGASTADMKTKLGVPKGHALADFLPLITIKAKDLANELTYLNIRRHNRQTEEDITREHELNNHAVRQLLVGRGIQPEALPPAEDIEKVERRVRQEEKEPS